MTSDAKVGLLLGLVFIVIIAFLMNGLPELLSRDSSSDLIRTTATHTNGSLRLDDQASDAVRRVRREMPNVSFQPRKIDMTEYQRKDPRFAVHKVEGTDDPIKDNFMPVAKKSSEIPVKAYTVQEGDMLATIAKKVYGKELGNRHATITKLFEANRDSLTSPDNILVGQKLHIPCLLSEEEVQARDRLESTGKFDKVKKMISGMVERPSAKKQVKEYVVKDGDSLWKIAEKVLSDARKVDEIRKLNSKVLPDGDTLTIGMRLQLPRN